MPSLTPLLLVALFIVTFTIALAAFEGGFYVGRRRSRLPDAEAQQPVRTLVASMLNLLAFVAGFTFGLAATHFDVRNQSILNETIAIRSAYHRADFLPDPERTEMKRLLRDYVDLRLEVAKWNRVDEALEHLQALQEKIWALAVAAQAKNVGPGFTTLAQSLTDVLDVHAWRVLAGFQSRIASGVWVILYGLMVTAAAAAGYQAGLAGPRRSIASVAHALAFAAVIVMIAAADDPGVGQTGPRYQPLIDLQASLRHGPHR